MSITLIYDEQRYDIPCRAENLTLLQVIFFSGLIPARPLCSGLGFCGKCKIVFHSEVPELTDAERKILTIDEQSQNIRLACKHKVKPFMVVELLSDNLGEKNRQKSINSHEIEIETNTQYRLYLDIGTTSMEWQCLPLDFSLENFADLDNLPKYLHGKDLNPQMFGGADVMSRLQNYTLLECSKQSDFPNLFSKVIYDYLKNVILELEKNSVYISEIYLAANPSIMALALGQNIEGLKQFPYILENKGNKYIKLGDLPSIWIAPQLSPFLGADVVAGLAYILSKKHYDNFLLADMGTNGEFLFWNKGTILGASVPLGPAIEGVGMRFGSPVYGQAENIILSFNLGMHGLEYQCKGEAKAICGAAYLSLIHILLNLGILDREGHFIEADFDKSSNLAKKISKNIQKIQGETRLYLTKELYLCADDVENILKVKSSFTTALDFLSKHNKIQHFYLGGALGEHIPINHLENLNFLSHGASENITILGNSSLKGLLALAHSKILLQEVLEKISKAKVLDLVSDQEFSINFIKNMHF